MEEPTNHGQKNLQQIRNLEILLCFFLTKKRFLQNNGIILIDLKDQSKIAMEFNNYYENIVQKSNEIKPNVLGTSKQSTNDY